MALPQVGVEAVIANLGKFNAGAKQVEGAFGKMSKSASGFAKVSVKTGKGFSDLGGKILKFGAIASTAAVVGIAALTAGVVKLGASTLSAGSDVAEMQSKFDVVFGESAPAAREELEKLAEVIGRNKFALQGYAATLQDTLVPLGFSREGAADMSVEVVGLAEDLASFNNLPTEDVILAIQSAMVGNTETLRQFGVVANQAAIEQEAMNLGLATGAVDADKVAQAQTNLEIKQRKLNEAIEKFGADSTQAASAQLTMDKAQSSLNKAMAGGKAELDANAKAQAIISLLMKGTTDAQGDAARTAGGWANQMRALTSTIEETQQEIGLALLPVMEPLLQNFVAMAQQVLPQLVNFMTSNVIPSFGNVIEIVKKLKGSFEEGFAAQFGNDFGALGQAAGGFEEIISDLTGNQTLVDFFIGFNNAILNLFETITGGEPVLGGLSGLLEGIGPKLTNLAMRVLPILTKAINFVNEHWDEFSVAFSAMAKVIENAAIIAVITKIGAVLLGLASPVGLIVAGIGLLSAAWAGNWFGIRDTLLEVWKVIKPIITNIQDTVENLIDAFQEGGISGIFEELFGGADIGTGIDTNLSGVIDSITTFLEDQFPVILDTLQQWADQFWDWLSGSGGVIDQASEKLVLITDAIVEWANDPATQQQLIDMGNALGQALVDGIAFLLENKQQLNDAMLKVLGAIASAIPPLLGALAKIGTDIAAGIITGIIEKITGKDLSDGFSEGLAKGLKTIVFPLGFLDDIFKDMGKDIDKKHGPGLIKSVKKSTKKMKGEINTFLKDTLAEWVEKWEEILSEFIDWSNETLSELGAFISDFISDWISWLTDLLSEFVSWAGDLLSEFSSFIGDMLSDLSTFISDFISDWISWLNDLLSEFVSWVSDTLSEFSSFISDMLSDLASFISDFISDWISWLSDLLSGFVTWVGDLLSQFSSFISDMLSNLASFIGDFLSQWASWLSDLLSGFVTWVGDLLSQFSSWIGDMLSNLSTFISDFISQWASWLSDVLSQLVSGLAEWLSEMAQGLTNMLSEFSTFVSDFISAVVEWITDIANTIRDNFNQVVDTLVGLLVSLLDTVLPGGAAYNAIVDIGTQIVAAILAGIRAVGDFVSNVGAWIRDRINEIADGLAAGTGLIVAAARRVGEGLLNAITDGITRFVTWVSNIKTAIQNHLSGLSFSGAATVFRNIGNAILSAIADGIRAGTNIARDFLRAVVQAVEDAIFGSPLKKPIRDVAEAGGEAFGFFMADSIGSTLSNTTDLIANALRLSVNNAATSNRENAESAGRFIGVSIAQGIVDGLVNSAGAVSATLSSVIASATTGIGNIAINAPVVSAPATAGGTAGGSTIQNFNVGGNTINSGLDEAVFEAQVLDIVRRNL